MFNAAAVRLNATEVPEPLGVELFTKILFLKSNVTVVAVAFAACCIAAEEKFAPVEDAFNRMVL